MKRSSDDAEFNYVVARFCPGTKMLSVYSHGTELQYGTQKDAEEFLAYVKRQTKHRSYRIIKIPI